MKIRTGDTVLVISGKDRGKTGKVLRVLPSKHHIVVEGLNLRVKYIKKTEQQAGQRITFEASLPQSKVMVLDPKTKKPTRVGFRLDAKTGKKERVARLSGTVIPKAAEAKPEKKTKTSDKPADKADKIEEKKKGRFWERMGIGKGAPATEDAPRRGGSEPDHPVAHQQHKAQSRGS